MDEEPVYGVVRLTHYYVSVVVPVPVDQASRIIEKRLGFVRSRSAEVAWEPAVPREAPAGVRYWPRLTARGVVLDRSGTLLPVEIEVWPWDEDRAEIGLRPVLGRGGGEAVRFGWVDLATSILQPLVSVLSHPAGHRRVA